MAKHVKVGDVLMTKDGMEQVVEVQSVRTRGLSTLVTMHPFLVRTGKWASASTSLYFH